MALAVGPRSSEDLGVDSVQDGSTVASLGDLDPSACAICDGATYICQLWRLSRELVHKRHLTVQLCARRRGRSQSIEICIEFFRKTGLHHICVSLCRLIDFKVLPNIL